VARDYLAVAGAAGAARFTYYGYSWGCVTGLQLALRTDRLDALACGGFPVIDGPYAEMLETSQTLERGAANFRAAARQFVT
jgi:pimeloyl-ACP methyl ester carboxylesterase